jgi:phosphoglucan, water dikinase
MQAKLPSFSESFTASVPLTRIRDIAHRNDIPSDLKREIKHTLQNKLHRNAGPEDLVATEAMLQRITAHGTNYSGAFVHEFRIFTDELRDFFNASGLVTVLQRVQPSLTESAVTDIARFLETKRQLDDGDNRRVVDCMHQLTSVRTPRHLLYVSMPCSYQFHTPICAEY